MNVLVINAGSSSLKYQLIDMSTESVLSTGLIERIGEQGTTHTYKTNCVELTKEEAIENHMQAIESLMAKLADEEVGVVDGMNDIDAVGHRVAHGGCDFTESALIDHKALKAIRDNIELAPLHNPANITGIESCMAVMPKTAMVAVFDTAFHQTMPRHAYLYGLPYEAYADHKIRRFGFHGTSHKFIAKRTAEILGKDIKTLKIISCHLGNGASIAAIQYGESVDTSMGFTPLEGLVMGTRCGDIDPAIPEYLSKKLNLSDNEMNDYLNKQSGVLGLSGKSNDFRDLRHYVAKGDERAKIAIEVYCYRIKKYIGAYTAAMDGFDAISFSAGIGENDAMVRKYIIQGMDYLGLRLDEVKNLSGIKEGIISTPGSKVAALVIKTNEELMIARETAEVLEKH